MQSKKDINKTNKITKERGKMLLSLTMRANGSAGKCIVVGTQWRIGQNFTLLSGVSNSVLHPSSTLATPNNYPHIPSVIHNPYLPRSSHPPSQQLSPQLHRDSRPSSCPSSCPSSSRRVSAKKDTDNEGYPAVVLIIAPNASKIIESSREKKSSEAEI